MIPTTFFAAAVVLSSFLAITDGVVVPRDGTFTYLTPQPTAPGTTTPVTSIASTHSTQSTQSTYSSQSTLNPWTYSTTPSTTSTYATSSTPYTTSSTPYTTSSTPYTTQSTPYTTQSTHSTQPTYTSPTTSQTTYPTNTGHGSVYPQPSSGPNPSPVQSNCDGVQPWQANLAYVAGNNVVFNGKLYTANQWSYNNSPATSAGEWTLDCDCSIPIGNKADCTGVAAWQKSQAYSAGSKVVYNGHLWVAVQWTSSNVPGDTSGTWKDLGACA